MSLILVIDDDPDIVGILKTVLETAGHTVPTAGTAEEGIEKIHSNPPDLIVLDIEMPGKGGLAVASELAKKNLQIPYLLCTASKLNDPLKAYDLYAVRYLYAGSLKKPMDIADIEKGVKHGLGHAQWLKDRQKEKLKKK